MNQPHRTGALLALLLSAAGCTTAAPEAAVILDGARPDADGGATPTDLAKPVRTDAARETPDAAARPVTIYVVQVRSDGYDPATLHIHLGDVVEWVWVDGRNSVTSGWMCTHDGLFDSGVLMAPASRWLKFDIPSVFPYYSATACDTIVGAIAVDP